MNSVQIIGAMKFYTEFPNPDNVCLPKLSKPEKKNS